ncbi:TetR/AcrR family transcriptional regulator [Bordetella bronchiseptica]
MYDRIYSMMKNPVRANTPNPAMTQPAPSPTVDGRRLRGERARARVLDEAARLLSVEGLDGITFGQLAERAEVGKSNLQVLFGDKERLQLAALDHAIALYQARVIEPAMRKRTPLARLRALMNGWFDFVGTRQLPGGCVITAASSEYRARPGPLRDAIQQYRDGARARLRELIHQAKAQGQLAADTNEARLAMDLLAYQAYANVAASMDDAAEFKRAKAAVVEMLAGGAG